MTERRHLHSLNLALQGGGSHGALTWGVLDALLEDGPVEFWAGLRPMTPDGPAILGATRWRNLFLNAGHGSNGWTQACGTSRVVADLVSGRQPEIDLEGLGAEGAESAEHSYPKLRVQNITLLEEAVPAAAEEAGGA